MNNADREQAISNQFKKLLTKVSPESISSNEIRFLPSRRSVNKSTTPLVTWMELEFKIKIHFFQKKID